MSAPATTPAERLAPRGPLKFNDNAIIVVRQGRVAVVRLGGVPPDAMPSAKMAEDTWHRALDTALADSVAQLPVRGEA